MGAQRVHGGGRYFNPRSPHGERHVKPLTAEDVLSISTHAPRTGSDARLANLSDMLEISTHAPRTGSDVSYSAHSFAISTFQPTLPARGATDGRRRTSAAAKDFNPRSPHGERRRNARRNARPARISTHAPRTGSDTARRCRGTSTIHFNPRSPHGERHAGHRQRD